MRARQPSTIKSIFLAGLPWQKVELRRARHRTGCRHTRLRRAAGGNRIAVDVDAEVLAGQDHRAVISQCHIEALRMFDSALERRHQSAVWREERRVEVVVVVRNQDATHWVNADSDRVIRDTLASDLTQKCSVVAENLSQQYISLHCASTSLVNWLPTYTGWSDWTASVMTVGAAWLAN